MKKIITSLIMKNRIKTLEMFWNIYIIINKRYKKEVWDDENGNTLMHYVGITHSKDLLDFAHLFQCKVIYELAKYFHHNR